MAPTQAMKVLPRDAEENQAISFGTRSRQLEMAAKGPKVAAQRDQLWRFTILAARARERLVKRELELSRALLAHRRRGFTNRLLTTYSTRHQWLVFVLAHFFITLLVWSHFFLKKFRQQDSVPESIPAEMALSPEDIGMPMPNYLGKRLMPPLQYALKHAILWQMVWIPVTMSRHVLALAARTKLRRLIPFEHMTFFHIAMGYATCCFVVASTVGFLAFFGHACLGHLGHFGSPREPEDFCSKMGSEIMITGLGISALTLIILGTSYLRRYMPFEWFYILHHLGFVFYGLAIAHTLDGEFRDSTEVGRARSQSFRFVSATFMLYMMDRLWSLLSADRKVKIHSVSVMEDMSMLTLELDRPANFRFAPGQYAYIQVPSVDMTFHPFSIGSAPQEKTLRFYIMLYSKGWTEKLAARLLDPKLASIDLVEVNVMGPFGPGFDTEGFASVGAIGAGTGIVPMLSMLRDRHATLQLMSSQVVERLREDPDKAARLPVAPVDEVLENLKLLYLQYTLKLRVLEKKPRLSRDTDQVYYHILFDIFSHLGMLLDMCQAFWGFSWKCLDEMDFASKFPKINEAQWEALEIMSLLSIAFFCVHRAYKWLFRGMYRVSLLDSVDLIAMGVMIGMHEFHSLKNPSAYIAPTTLATVLRGAFAVWRIARMYQVSHELRCGSAIVPDSRAHRQIQNSRFSMLWISRGVDSFVHMFQDLEPMASEVLSKFGPAQLRSLFGIDIYLTSVRPSEEMAVRQMLKGSALEGCVHFERPDIEGWVVDRMSDVLSDSLRKRNAITGGSLIAYCGSRKMGSLVGSGVQAANTQATVLHAHSCRMAFQEEDYGVQGGGKPKQPSHSPSRDAAARDRLAEKRIEAGVTVIERFVEQGSTGRTVSRPCSSCSGSELPSPSSWRRQVTPGAAELFMAEPVAAELDVAEQHTAELCSPVALDISGVAPAVPEPEDSEFDEDDLASI